MPPSICARESDILHDSTDLHREGIGVEIKHAPITSGDEEIILWEWHILGCHLPTALNEGYFFLNGNNFVSEVAKNTGSQGFTTSERE